VQQLLDFPSANPDFYRAVELQNQWVLVWSDEFDGDALDLTKWGKEENNYGGGNNEAQHYSMSEKYAYLENGLLNIAVYRDSYTSNDGKTQPYSSARLRTLQRGDWTYGRIETRAKVPGGEGIWPAIWMLPSGNVYGTWAASGEIDILESKGTQTDRTYATIHFGGTWPNNTYLGDTYYLSGDGPDFAEDFHIYVLEWHADRLVWYVDGVEIQTITKDQWHSTAAPESDTAPFDQDFHLLINVAVNGGFFNGTGQNADNLPDESFPQLFQVDYIRVYQWATE